MLVEPRPLPVLVDEINGLSGAKKKYRIRFSDGSQSDPLTFDELDGVTRLLLAQQCEEPSDPPKSTQRRRPRGGIGRKIQRHIRAKDKNRQRVSRKQAGAPPLQPRALSQFNTTNQASQLCDSIDEDWNRERADDKENIAQFPSIPDDSRLRRTIRKWRKLVSAPHIDMANCAVCAERMLKTLIRTFALSDSTAGDHNVIGPAVLEFMQHQLVHDPLLPSHMGDLPEGTHFVLPLMSPSVLTCICQKWQHYTVWLWMTQESIESTVRLTYVTHVYLNYKSDDCPLSLWQMEWNLVAYRQSCRTSAGPNSGC